MVVFPGIVAQADAIVRYEGDAFSGELGVEVWVQGAERFLSISGTDNVALLDSVSARQSSAFQQKMWLTLSKKQIRQSVVSLGLHVAAVPLNYGVGKQFSFAFTGAYDF